MNETSELTQRIAALERQMQALTEWVERMHSDVQAQRSEDILLSQRIKALEAQPDSAARNVVPDGYIPIPQSVWAEVKMVAYLMVKCGYLDDLKDGLDEYYMELSGASEEDRKPDMEHLTTSLLAVNSFVEGADPDETTNR